MNNKSAVVFAALAVLLSGCALEGRQPAQTYVLQAPVLPAATQPGHLHVKLLPPEMGTGLGTRQIAVIDEALRLDYVGQGEWPESLPLMLQNLWVDSLRQSGLVASASSDQSGTRPDRLLQLSVIEFNFHKAADRVTARVRYEAKLLEPASRKVLTVRQAEAMEPVPGGDFAKAVASLDRANAQAMTTLLADLANDLDTAKLR
jgi:cholesterol transport system auxiliary component